MHIVEWCICERAVAADLVEHQQTARRGWSPDMNNSMACIRKVHAKTQESDAIILGLRLQFER